jgi:murein L,D-transpeptidase YafK
LLKKIQIIQKLQNTKPLRPYFLYLFLIFILFLLSNSMVFCAEQNFPSSIIKLPENENAILIEKKTQTLFLYSAVGSDLEIQFKATISTGESSGIKQKAGDKKTPEGIYFLKDEYEDKYLSPIYGKKAFPTDYPNFIDKRAGKNGSAIWIHGTNKKLIPMDSNGCVALENSNILKLSDYVNIDSTPVIMMEELDKIDKLKLTEQRKQIITFLNQWMQAIETGSYHKYLSFYSSQYLPDISWWEDWNEIRKQAKKLNLPLKVKGEKIGIYYHNNVFVALFECFLTFKDEKILLGKRKLFLEEKNNYEIIGDVFQTVPEQLKLSKTPLIAAAKIYVKPASKKDSVIETINQWLAAWSAKDMNMYASFYDSNFHSDGLNKKNWVKRKRTLAKKYDFINVTGSKFEVEQKKQVCEVLFFQEYESSGLTTLGTKRLKLVNKGGLWKISQESWKEK